MDRAYLFDAATVEALRAYLVKRPYDEAAPLLMRIAQQKPMTLTVGLAPTPPDRTIETDGPERDATRQSE